MDSVSVLVHVLQADWNWKKWIGTSLNLMAQEIVTTILGAAVHQLAIYCRTVSKEMYCFTGLCSLCLFWSFPAEVTLELKTELAKDGIQHSSFISYWMISSKYSEFNVAKNSVVGYGS